MPDFPPDDPRFLAAYASAAGAMPRAPVIEGGLAAAVALYKASDSFKMLAPTVRAQRRPMLDDLAERYGFAPAKELARKHIEKDLARLSGHPRNNHLKMRLLCMDGGSLWFVSRSE